MAREPDLDDCVRQALNPDAGVVERMVATALDRGRAPMGRRSQTWRLVLAAAAVLVGALWVGRHQLGRPAPTDDIVLTRAGNVVMIQSRSGETWILGPEVAPDPARAGTGFVIVEGDSR
jgi:hypothetical protein